MPDIRHVTTPQKHSPMIISCPSCATRFELAASRFAPEGTIIKCASCGHSWLEARAIEVVGQTGNIPAVIDHGFEPDFEIRRLVEATREAQEEFATRRRQRNRRLAGWASFAAAIMAPFAVAAALPEMAVSIAPATIAAFDAVGADVNIYGLELRRVELQHMVADGTRVLAVKGEIANISKRDRKIPWLRFGLLGEGNSEVYDWTLDAGARPLKPGEITTFVTRVASPPKTAKIVEIRFAHSDEIGSIPTHD